LGENICNSQIVRESKLTGEESLFFDRPLSIQDLDKSIDKLNENSAGGLDGISTKFLKKFWAFIRVPLHKYSLEAIDTGSLTQ
jgi:hypothetical protein